MPSPPSYSMSQSRDQLSLLFSDSLQSSAMSSSRSLSPIEPSKLLVSKSEETCSLSQSAAMAIASESLGFDNLDSFVKTQPKGVIQVCLNLLLKDGAYIEYVCTVDRCVILKCKV